MKTYKVRFEPRGTEVEVVAGTSLKKAMEMAGIEYDFVCGGRGRCGKCRIKLVSGRPAVGDDEQKILGAQDLEQGIRLACKIKVDEDLVIELMSSGKHQILTSSLVARYEKKPHLRKFYLQLPKPTIKDQRSHWHRLKDELVAKNPAYADLKIPLHLLYRLTEVLRKADYKVTAVVDDDWLLGLEEGNTAKTMLGFAVDIGTTTIVGYLMDLYTGKELATASTLNPQTQFGGDVITRTNFASHEGGLEQLHKTVVTAINELLAEACAQAQVELQDVYAVAVVGNTCMHHLFLGVNPEPIAKAPYVSVISEMTSYPAPELNLAINPAGKVYVLPNIGGFVGADTVGVLLTTDIEQSDRIKLVIDIGTNGEIVLGSKQRLVACSAAAGPAFEGAQITYGMRGAAGAIDHVLIDEDIEISVIGNEKPKGICGSGLLDVVAELLKLGIVDWRGRMLTPDQWDPEVAKRFGDRLIEIDGMKAFVLVKAGESALGKPITITQKDIRELQLAKGAIATGIRILMMELGIAVEDIDEVLLAGAFGNYLNPYSACRIGLIPMALFERIRPVGNAAGTGAKIALLSRQQLQRANALARTVEHIELSGHPRFTEVFAEALNYPRD